MFLMLGRAEASAIGKKLVNCRQQGFVRSDRREP
jgi:hypothetical protein